MVFPLFLRGARSLLDLRGVLGLCGTREGLIENNPMSPVSVEVRSILSKPKGVSIGGYLLSRKSGRDGVFRDRNLLAPGLRVVCREADEDVEGGIG